MHLPPAAQWRLGRGRAHGAVLVLAAAVHITFLFFLRGHVAPAAWWGLLLLALALLLHAGWRWWTSAAGVLRWTGREWRWMSAPAVQDAQMCELHWVLDLQSVALVHVVPAVGAGGHHWLWLERGAQGSATWRALRRALLASSASAVQEALHTRTAAFGGTSIFSADYLTGPKAPQLKRRRASATSGAIANGFQDSTLR